MISCKEAARRISESQDSPLPWRERVLLRLHLCLCGMCRTYRRQVQIMHELIAPQLRDPSGEYAFSAVQLTPSGRERILAAITAEIDSEPDSE